MIRFTARSANLLLAAQGRALIGEGALIRDGALNFFDINMSMKSTLMNNNRNCNTNDYNDMGLQSEYHSLVYSKSISSL